MQFEIFLMNGLGQFVLQLQRPHHLFVGGPMLLLRQPGHQFGADARAFHQLAADHVAKAVDQHMQAHAQDRIAILDPAMQLSGIDHHRPRQATVGGGWSTTLPAEKETATAV